MTRCARLLVLILAGLLTLATGVSAAAPVAAAPDDAPGSATVRVVVRTAPGARDVTAQVTRAAAAVGGRRTGRLSALHALSLTVPLARLADLRRSLSRLPGVTAVDAAQQRWFTAEPNDPHAPVQRPYLVAMGLEAAWDRGATGSPGVRIAIVDSGVDVTHPDLAGKVVGAYDAVTGGTDVHDVVGHGTGTASVAAAATDNGVGIAGAGRASSLLAVKVADVTGRIFTDDLARGIVWAVNHGATVVNLSLGGPNGDPLEAAAVAYAQQHGALVVAAAGNAGTAAKQYPGALSGVLAVGATSADGSVRAPFSSYGSWVDLAAPGRSILVATPGGGFESADGTSFSAPLVSGAAALLAAYRPGRRATDLAQALAGGTDTARYGFAHGLVHVDRSLDLLPPAAAPVLTAPAPGSTASGIVAVSATTASPRVRFRFADQTATVVAVGGNASASFETWGLAGAQPVGAVGCSVAEQCDSTGADRTVLVANAAPVVTSPSAGAVLTGGSVAVAAGAPGGSVRFDVDGRGAGSRDAASPFTASLDLTPYADGAHTIHAVLCRSDGSVCDTGHPGGVPVTIDQLHPAVVSARPGVISPGAEGPKSTSTLTYRLDRSQSVALLVRGPTGAVALRRSLGTQTPGVHTVVWAGRGSAGHVVPDGTYTVGISTTAGGLVGGASAPVRVDRTAPALRGVRASAHRVLPIRDGYLDEVRVTGLVSEPAMIALQVRSPGGSLITTIRSTSAPSPTARTTASTLSWDGRSSGGRLVPGTYRLTVTATDRAGNITTSRVLREIVTQQRLVLRHGTVTVRARASLDESFADGCSSVFRRTGKVHSGWLAYASSSTCTSGDAYAAGTHHVRLPAAVRYGKVRVSAYGGSGDPRYRDTARLVLLDRLENLSDAAFRLGAPMGMHSGPWVKAAPLLVRSRSLLWTTVTTGIDWYDVRSYRVDVTYYSLG